LHPQNIVEEGKKRGEIHGQRKRMEEDGYSDHFLWRESMCSSLVLKRTKK
jgi:hypothetical protein